VDVYDSIPTIVTTFVAIIAKISIFIFLLELVHYTSKSFDMDFSWTMSLLFSSLLSLVIGTIVGLTQTRIKRLYAFSTISHVGFILLALSIHSVESTQAFLFYLMQYSISNLNAFMLIITIGYSLYCYVYKVNDSISSKTSSNEEKHEVKEANEIKEEKIKNALELDIYALQIKNESNKNTNHQDKDNLQDINNSPALRSGKPLFRELWPNSGDPLKLMKPSIIQKDICGWTNYSGTVINHKMSENEMGCRGSKSDVSLISVKEQRVDGHRCINLMHLRYALMGFERNYPIRIPSNQLITLRKSYSSLSKNPLSNMWQPHLSTDNINPWFFTGFSDGESNFTVRIFKSNSTKLGWTIQPVFQIGLHKKDINLLEKIKTFLGVGTIYHKEESSNYMIQSLRDLSVIINHFNKYPLLTKKWEDFKLFSEIVTLINQKEHLSLSGFHKIISLRASMNNGLSRTIKTAFPENTPAIRPKRSDEDLLNSNIDPYWMAGFASAEGCFSIRITKSLTTKSGYQVQLRFQITQHSIDKVFMNSLDTFWGCGKVFLRFRENKVDFQILKLKDLSDKVIPLFQSISLQGVKFKDFTDFCKAVEIMKVKGHLTSEGLNEIRKLKLGMNRGRE